jgi:hypothetical protein
MSRTQARRQVGGQRARRARSVPPRGGRNLVTAACIALGCWGVAFTYTFLTIDPNRYVYGGMMAVIALIWSVLCVLRLRARLRQG